MGKQALEAYRALASRLFAPEGPSLELLIIAVEPSIDQSSSSPAGYRVRVSHRLRLSTSGGIELATYDIDEWADIASIGADAIPVAFEAAARNAAQAFEAAFENKPRIAEWLAANGVQPGLIPRRGRVHAPILPMQPRHVRGDRVAYLDAGVHVQPYQATLNVNATLQRAGGDTAFGLADLRAGVASRWLFLQGNFSRWSSTLEGAGSSLSAIAIGIDAGILVRLQDWFELSAGAGGQFVYATATDAQQIWVTRRTVIPDALLAVRYTPQLVSRTWRISLEYRRRLSTVQFTFADSPAGPRTWRDVDIGNSYAILIGGELGASNSP